MKPLQQNSDINVGIDYLFISFASYFKLIDEIANYSLSQLEDIVNSKEVLDDCKHNQDWFLSQNETHRLVRAFGRILDK